MDAALGAIIQVATAAAQGAGNASQAVMSAMMLAMVASAVVSTVSMSAVMVQRAQQAATPSPAAALAALIATPSPTPRPTIARRERAPPVQQVTETSISRSIAWAPPAPPAPEVSKGDGGVNTVVNPHEIHVPSQTAAPLAPPGPQGCNVTYTKTVTTITMEASGNVSHSQQYTWFVPCADAPSLPPVGAPDPAAVTRTTSLLGKPLASHTGGDDGDAAGPNVDDSTILFGPDAHRAPAPAPAAPSASNTLASLLASNSSLAAQLALSPGGDASSQLAALLAADPSLKDRLPPGALAALGPTGAGDIGGAGPQYDVYGRPVTNPLQQAAADAAEDALPLLLGRNTPKRSQEERDAQAVQARAEQRAWWDAELEKARREAHGGPRPVDFSRRAGTPLASEAHPVRIHVATDLAQVGLSASEGERWSVRSEVFNYEERMEWKKELGAMPARRFLRELGRPWSAARARRRHPHMWLGWIGQRVGSLAKAVGRVRRWLQGLAGQRLKAAQGFSGVGQNHWSAHFPQ